MTHSNTEVTHDLGKVAIFYHCHPANHGLENLTFFLDRGYLDDPTFFISCADFEPPASWKNINFFSTENDSHDFGGHARNILNHCTTKEFDFFLFINSSVKGPFQLSTNYESWPCKFLNRLNKRVGAVGSTINCLSQHSPHFHFLSGLIDPKITHYHIQTYCYALTADSLKVLLEQNFYRFPTRWSKAETIINYELNLSKILLAADINIACLVKEFQDIDFRVRSEETMRLETVGDPCFPGAIFGRTLDPYEVLFVKTNR